MTRYTKIAAAAAAALLAAPAFAAMTTDANLELDNDYQNTIKASKPNPREPGLTQGGRVEFNVAGKAGDDNGFVAGRGTLLIKKDGSTGADDMWGQIGTGMANVKLGRFEAADMFPLGKDTFVENGANASNPLALLRTNTLRGRFGSNVFHGAVGVTPGGGVSIEVGVVESKTTGQAKGVRPVVAFAAGPLTVKVGLETGRVTAVSKFTNFGATVGGSFGDIGFNVNLSSGKHTPNGGTAIKSTAFGANATMGPAGVGLILEKDKQGAVKNSDTAFYAAYSIPLFNTGATLTPAASVQTGKANGVKQGNAYGVRARLNYTF